MHHSPHRLYWVNSARVHPFEKLAHFTIDIVPFVLLGVSKEALAVYYVLWGRDRLLPALQLRRALRPSQLCVQPARSCTAGTTRS